jgi:predicted HD phosphohydrolase
MDGGQEKIVPTTRRMGRLAGHDISPTKDRNVQSFALVLVSPFSSIDEHLVALNSLEGEPSGDVVSALPHLLQTAENLAALSPDDYELIAAGLVHDLASSLDPQCEDHAAAGAVLVEGLLGHRVAALIAGHTDAKRYLVTTEGSYAGFLSAGSTHTLAAQGGEMSGQELDSFRERSDWRTLVVLRRADDAAKVPQRAVRPLVAWTGLLTDVAGRHSEVR